MRFQESGGGQILHPPSVQFKLYQGEVLQYKPSTRDWVDSTQSETRETAFQSVRGTHNIMIKGAAVVYYN